MNTISFVSTEERVLLSSEINKSPGICLDDIDQKLEEYRAELKVSEEKYITELDNLQYQKSLIERKTSVSSRTDDSLVELVEKCCTTMFDGLDAEIQDLIKRHNSHSDRINSAIERTLKLRKIFLEINPLSPRKSKSEPASPRASVAANPKLPKSNSFIKRSLDYLKQKG
jgi:hypothetical protein